MRVSLYYRKHGIHRFIKQEDIGVSFGDIYVKDNNINEDLLLSSLPEGFLPVHPKRILLTVCNKYGSGTGQIGLNKFLSWAKYFDSYVLELEME